MTSMEPGGRVSSNEVMEAPVVPVATALIGAAGLALQDWRARRNAVASLTVGVVMLFVIPTIFLRAVAIAVERRHAAKASGDGNQSAVGVARAASNSFVTPPPGRDLPFTRPDADRGRVRR
jgi:hypothetical protein